MITNIKCLEQACKGLNIRYSFLDQNQNFLKIYLDKPYYFVNSSVPFNADSLSNIFLDKEFTYQSLKDFVRIPETVGFLDPCVDTKYQGYAHFKSIDNIADFVTNKFGDKVIIKRNRGAQGSNVFACNSIKEIESAIKQIFDQQSKYYDYVALAQPRIDIDKEYRVIVFRQEIILSYLKDISNAEFIGNLSPLHWKGSKARLVKEEGLNRKFLEFLQPIFNEMQLEYAGFDLATDKLGNIWLIEINSKPSFDIFVRDNGETEVVSLYTRMLSSLL